MDVVDVILSHEGHEYTNRSADKGGPTKFGITIPTLSAHRGHPCNEQDVKDLTEGEARETYTKMYVTPFTSLKDAKVREQMIDFGVTSGPETSIKVAQQLLSLPKDGVLGPKTVAAINADKSFGNKFAVSRAKYYAGLVDRDQRQLPNLMGWLNRALSYVA
jgi:lysozyme family protein